jgi:hypothetical protein
MIVSPLIVVVCCLIKSEINLPRFATVPVENVEVLNGALQMIQNLAERVGRLRSRPVVSLARSHL